MQVAAGMTALQWPSSRRPRHQLRGANNGFGTMRRQPAGEAFVSGCRGRSHNHRLAFVKTARYSRGGAKLEFPPLQRRMLGQCTFSVKHRRSRAGACTFVVSRRSFESLYLRMGQQRLRPMGWCHGHVRSIHRLQAGSMNCTIGLLGNVANRGLRRWVLRLPACCYQVVLDELRRHLAWRRWLMR